MKQILKHIIVRPGTRCWMWIGARNSGGYGHVKVAGKVVSAHRRAYELWVGPITEGMDLCHTCDHPACVNPDHLFLGTTQQNVRDAMRKGRWFTRKRFEFWDRMRKPCAAS